MIILGIDPGTANSGYAVIKVPDDILGREFKYDIELIDFGNIVTPKERTMPERLLLIHDHLNQIIEKHTPGLIVTEMLFFGANTRTAISVGQARGVIMLSAGKYGIPMEEYTGPSIKLMITGSGRADKNQVHEGVRNFLGKAGRKSKKLVLPTKKQVGYRKGSHLDDATDAIAIAITHVLKLAAK